MSAITGYLVQLLAYNLGLQWTPAHRQAMHEARERLFGESDYFSTYRVEGDLSAEQRAFIDQWVEDGNQAITTPVSADQQVAVSSGADGRYARYVTERKDSL